MLLSWLCLYGSVHEINSTAASRLLKRTLIISSRRLNVRTYAIHTWRQTKVYIASINSIKPFCWIYTMSMMCEINHGSWFDNALTLG